MVVDGVLCKQTQIFMRTVQVLACIDIIMLTKMISVQTQKDLIESMIAEDDKIEGLEHVECKVFK